MRVTYASDMSDIFHTGGAPDISHTSILAGMLYIYIYMLTVWKQNSEMEM